MGPGILLLSVAAAAPVTTDQLPIGVEAAAGWRTSVRAPGVLTVARDAPPAEFALSFEAGIQRDMSGVTLDVGQQWLSAELARVGERFRWGEVVVERIQHPVLGPGFVLSTDGRAAGTPQVVRMRFATWAGPAGRVLLGGGIYADPRRVDALFAEALDALVWSDAPIAHDAFEWGHVALDGFALDLPDGWRSVHSTERATLGLDPHQALAFEPSMLHGPIGCATNEQPIEVIAPERMESYAQRFRLHARALLAGGGLTLRAAPRVLDPRNPSQRLPIRVGADEPGTLEVVRLGDRDGYFWRVAGTAGEQPVEIAMIYTTLGDHSAECVYVSTSPISEALSASLRSLRATNGQPPYQTLMGRYIQHWPFRHPLLQIWWLGAVLLAIPVALLLRLMR